MKILITFRMHIDRITHYHRYLTICMIVIIKSLNINSFEVSTHFGGGAGLCFSIYLLLHNKLTCN